MSNLPELMEIFTRLIQVNAKGHVIITLCPCMIGPA